MVTIGFQPAIGITNPSSRLLQRFARKIRIDHAHCFPDNRRASGADNDPLANWMATSLAAHPTIHATVICGSGVF